MMVRHMMEMMVLHMMVPHICPLLADVGVFPAITTGFENATIRQHRAKAQATSHRVAIDNSPERSSGYRIE
jgi:hypothetical protein